MCPDGAPFDAVSKSACGKFHQVGNENAPGSSNPHERVVGTSSKCCGEISPQKSARVDECVRYNRNDRSGMSIDENRVSHHLSPWMDAKAISWRIFPFSRSCRIGCSLFVIF